MQDIDNITISFWAVLLQISVGKLHNYLPGRLHYSKVELAETQSWELTKKHATASALHC